MTTRKLIDKLTALEQSHTGSSVIVYNVAREVECRIIAVEVDEETGVNIVIDNPF